MTLQDKICDAGVTTLAEFICDPCSGGGGVVYTELIELKEADVETLTELECAELSDADTPEILTEIEALEIIEIKEEELDGICEI